MSRVFPEATKLTALGANRAISFNVDGPTNTMSPFGHLTNDLFPESEVAFALFYLFSFFPGFCFFTSPISRFFGWWSPSPALFAIFVYVSLSRCLGGRSDYYKGHERRMERRGERIEGNGIEAKKGRTS
jgi:hypothetical protein